MAIPDVQRCRPRRSVGGENLLEVALRIRLPIVAAAVTGHSPRRHRMTAADNRVPSGPHRVDCARELGIRCGAAEEMNSGKTMRPAPSHSPAVRSHGRPSEQSSTKSSAFVFQDASMSSRMCVDVLGQLLRALGHVGRRFGHDFVDFLVLSAAGARPLS